MQHAFDHGFEILAQRGVGWPCHRRRRDFVVASERVPASCQDVESHAHGPHFTSWSAAKFIGRERLGRQVERSGLFGF